MARSMDCGLPAEPFPARGTKSTSSCSTWPAPRFLVWERLEMIAGHVGSDYLYISDKGVWTLLLETAEDTRVIGAEF